jgi:hypothetical protein
MRGLLKVAIFRKMLPRLKISSGTMVFIFFQSDSLGIKMSRSEAMACLVEPEQTKLASKRA